MDEYIETGDCVKLKVTFWKSGKQPLLLLHGWGGNQQSFTFMVGALKGDYTIISFDQRGFGDSEKPDDCSYSINRLTLDLREVLEKLDLRDVILLGWSMGGVVAANYIDIYGKDRVAELVLIDVNVRMMSDENYRYGFYDGTYDEKELLRDLIMLAEDFPRFARNLPERSAMVFSGPEQRSAFVKKVIEQNTKPYPLVALWLAIAAADLTEIYKRLNVPVLFCHGGKSAFCSQKACEFVMGILPHAVLAEFAECSHFIPIERPAQLAEVIDNFAQTGTVKGIL